MRPLNNEVFAIITPNSQPKQFVARLQCSRTTSAAALVKYAAVYYYTRRRPSQQVESFGQEVTDWKTQWIRLICILVLFALYFNCETSA